VNLTSPYPILWWLTVGLVLINQLGPAVLVGFFAGLLLWITVFPLALREAQRHIARAYQAVLAFSIVCLLAFAAWPGSSTFTVSPQTTYVTGPLDKDGYVDYVTALNERLGKGITPEKNANVLICQALGPHPEGSILPAEYFQWLGIDPPRNNSSNEG